MYTRMNIQSEHACVTQRSARRTARSKYINGIAKGGHFEVLKWARTNGCEWDESTCDGAALVGDLDMLKWARENGCEWDKVSMCGRACERACGCACLYVARRLLRLSDS